MKRTFFIAGLPRSRTAWLANFLTYGDSFCFHEACRKIAAVDQLPELFRSVDSPNVGTADCAFPLYYDQALTLLPESHIVIVRRDADECQASYVQMMEELLQASPVQVTETFDTLRQNLGAMREALSNRHVLEVRFDELHKEGVVRAVWDHCTGGAPFNAARWRELAPLRVTVKPGEVITSLRLTDLRAIFKVPGVVAPVRSSAGNALTMAFNETIAGFCAKTPGAWQWIGQLWEILLTWDHIVDRDVIDTGMAQRAIAACCLEWPFNPFFDRHKAQLVPVMVNVMSAWHHANQTGDTVKMWDAYSEIPCAAAFLIGGTALVDQVMPGLRTLVQRMRDEHEKAKL